MQKIKCPCVSLLFKVIVFIPTLFLIAVGALLISSSLYMKSEAIIIVIGAAFLFLAVLLMFFGVYYSGKYGFTVDYENRRLEVCSQIYGRRGYNLGFGEFERVETEESQQKYFKFKVSFYLKNGVILSVPYAKLTRAKSAAHIEKTVTELNAYILSAGVNDGISESGGAAKNNGAGESGGAANGGAVKDNGNIINGGGISESGGAANGDGYDEDLTVENQLKVVTRAIKAQKISAVVLTVFTVGLFIGSITYAVMTRSYGFGGGVSGAIVWGFFGFPSLLRSVKDLEEERSRLKRLSEVASAAPRAV